MARLLKHGEATVKEVRRRKLPEKCECGGAMQYSFGFNRVWSYCDKCATVETISTTMSRRKGNP